MRSKRITHLSLLLTLSAMVLAVPAVRMVEATPAAEESVATVNGVAILKRDFERDVRRLQEALLSRGKPLTCEQIQTINQEVLESLIRRELLFQESRRAGVRVDPKEIDREIEELKKQYLSEAEFRRDLNQRGLTETELRSHVERTMSIQKYIDQTFKNRVEVSDGEIISYYENNLSLFRRPHQVRVSHLLIQTDPKDDPSRKREARQKIERIQREIRNGKEFEKLAREHSDGPTRSSGGDLGYIRRGQLDPELERVVFNLKVGELSEIVETEYGFHLFKLVDRKPETILAYDHVKDGIRQTLLTEKAKLEADQFARTLRQKASVVILLPELKQRMEK